MPTFHGNSGLLTGSVAAVTGASSGIGRAVAIALAREGASVCALGRNLERLNETLAMIESPGSKRAHPIDLTVSEEIESIPSYLDDEFGRLDILVHAAGVVHQSRMEHARMETLDLQYRINLRAPYQLTQELLPMLKQAKGQIAFVNSSAGITASRPDIGQYAAMKHALRAVADSLRQEVNEHGIRVVTVYPGRTATPGQETIHRSEGKTYYPERLLQAEDIANVLVKTIVMPRTAEVTDIHIRPMNKPEAR